MIKQFKKQDVVTLGKVSGSIWRKEELTEGQLNHHVHIVGASGYGKTVLLSQIVKQRVQLGKGLLFIDLKGDMETIMRFSNYLNECNRLQDLHIFSLSDQKISIPYNLIADGTATQLRDRIMMSLNWSEEFYKNQAASFLLKLLLGLCHIRDEHNFQFHLGTILDCTKDSEAINGLAQKVSSDSPKIRGYLEECYSFINNTDSYKSLQGLRTQLESLVLSDFGEMISTEKPGINLFDIVSNGGIAFMFLDTRRYGETAKTVGKFILQDLKAVSAKVDCEVPKDQRTPFSIIIDEFADLAQEDFISFLDRARSANMSVVIAHQEICDLQRISPEFAGRLMGNTSTLYAFLQKLPDSAEIISAMAGTRTVWKSTRQTERFGFFEVDAGKGSKREVEEFNIHPNTIKSLRVGKCVCVKKYPKARAYLVDVNS